MIFVVYVDQLVDRGRRDNDGRLRGKGEMGDFVKKTFWVPEEGRRLSGIVLPPSESREIDRPS